MQCKIIKRTVALLTVALLVTTLFAASLQAQEPQSPVIPDIPYPEPEPVAVKQPHRPLVLIAEVVTDPAPIVPGEPFVLKLKVKNHGNQQARRIVLTLQSLEGETTLKCFSPLGQSNVFYLDQLSVGVEKWLQCKLIAGPGVTGGIYNLVFHLSYINPAGEPFESTAVTGVILQSQSALDLIEMNYPGSVLEGESFTIKGHVINNGSAPVRGVGLLVIPGENFQAEQGETYFGTFNEGDSDVFDLSITALQPGKNILNLELYYSDAMNRKQTLEKELQIEVLKNEDGNPANDRTPGEGKSENSFWSRFKNFLAALFGLGGS